MKQELGGFAHRPHEEQQTGDGQGIHLPGEEVDRCPLDRRRVREDRLVLDRVEQNEHGEDAQREAEIADPVDDKRLDRRGIGSRPLIPEPDQQVGGEPHALPAEEQLNQVVGRHQGQHGEREQREIGEEPRPVWVMAHVADRVEMDERRDRGDHDQHDHGERIDPKCPVDRHGARRKPVEHLNPFGNFLPETDGNERDP